MTIYFLKDLVRGTKKCKCPLTELTIFTVKHESEIKVLNVPLFEGLSIEDILEFTIPYPIMN